MSKEADAKEVSFVSRKFAWDLDVGGNKAGTYVFFYLFMPY